MRKKFESILLNLDTEPQMAVMLGISFGLWMQSFAAGIFMANLMLTVFTTLSRYTPNIHHVALKIPSFAEFNAEIGRMEESMEFNTPKRRES